MFDKAWITLNRVCNLRCKWCYASETGFSNIYDMDLMLAYKLVDFCSDAGVKSIFLIGGEPTLYNGIIPLISYINNLGIKPMLITNGLVFCDNKILNEYIKAGIYHIALSAKGNTEEEFLKTTGSNSFKKFVQSVKNISKEDVNYSLSEVLTVENIPFLSKGVSFFKSLGVSNFGFTFCSNFNIDGKSHIEYLKNNNPYELASLFYTNYADIDKALDGCNWNLELSIPLCTFDRKLIEEMNNKKQIISVCHLQKEGYIVFDTNGYVIPCNMMYPIKLGQFGVDFNDYQSYLSFREKEDIKKIYNRFKGAPDKECLSCKDSINCGGGCITNWTNYSFSELKNKIKDEFLNKKKQAVD